MKQHEWILSQGRKLSAMIQAHNFTVTQTPVVICCHGFTSEKVGSNQLMLHIANAIEAAGLIALRFDFTGSGESGGDFAADTTIKNWREDLGNVIEWVKNLPEFEGLPIYLLGHSLAGRIALAPVTEPLANFQDIILGPELWRQSLAGLTVANFLGKGFSLSPNFVKDLLANRYDPLAHSRRYHAPLLIVHGREDIVVPPAGSEVLYDSYKGSKEIVRLPADHVFTGRHEELTAHITGWLLKQKDRLVALRNSH